MCALYCLEIRRMISHACVMIYSMYLQRRRRPSRLEHTIQIAGIRNSRGCVPWWTANSCMLLLSQNIKIERCILILGINIEPDDLADLRKKY